MYGAYIYSSFIKFYKKKKAYELSTLTGTQVLLLVVSETGLVYTFTTPKLQPLVTKPEGKNLIQSCLNAPDPLDTVDHHQQPSQQPNSRSIMSTNAPASPPTVSTTLYYYVASFYLLEKRYTYALFMSPSPFLCN